MKAKKILLVILALVSMMAFAGGLYTTVTKIQGSTKVDQEVSFKVSYKWLSSGERTGKVIYSVAGTKCQGEINIDKHTAVIPVSGESEIKCTFDKEGTYTSSVSLQLYEDNAKKEQSDSEQGIITVIK